MSLTDSQAVKLLNLVTTEAQLRALIDDLDISATGDVTVLYSDKINDSLHSSSVINGMLERGMSVRVLDNTEAFEFLNENDNLNDALRRIFNSDPDERGSTANQFLFGGKETDGSRIPNGAWDTISRNFAPETIGAVKSDQV